MSGEEGEIIDEVEEVSERWIGVELWLKTLSIWNTKKSEQICDKRLKTSNLMNRA